MKRYFIESPARTLLVMLIVGTVTLAVGGIVLWVFFFFGITKSLSVLMTTAIVSMVGYYWGKYVQRRWGMFYYEIRLEHKGRGRIILIRNDFKGQQVNYKEIPFSDIVSYTFGYLNGGSIRMRLSNGKSIILIENELLSKTEALHDFIMHFEDAVARRPHLGIAYQKNWMEGRMWKVLAIAIGLLVLAAICHSIIV